MIDDSLKPLNAPSYDDKFISRKPISIPLLRLLLNARELVSDTSSLHGYGRVHMRRNEGDDALIARYCKAFWACNI